MKDDKSTPNPVGRPTKLTDELIAKAQEYLFCFNDEEVGDIVPSVAGLACYLGVSKQTIYNYKDLNSEFLDTLEAIEVMQEKLLINGSLSSVLNAQISKLMLSNHGYSDKQAVEHTGDPSNPIEHKHNISLNDVLEARKQIIDDY